MKIAIASGNQGKINEFKKILEPLGYQLITAADLGVDMSVVEETGTTFSENAKLKSDYLYEKAKITSIADDSGLVIEALPDILGVTSARFMGESTSYKIKNNEIIKQLKDKENRRAYFKSAISLTSSDDHQIFTGIVKGHIAQNIQGEKGFGYDPIFIPDGYDVSFGILEERVKNEISHRAKALKDFEGYLHEK